MAASKVTSDSIYDDIESKGVAIVDFWAEWCAPCVAMTPNIEKLSDEYSDIFVGKLNVDEYGDIATEFSIRSIPTLVIFKDGEEVERTTGMKQFVELEQIVKKYL